MEHDREKEPLVPMIIGGCMVFALPLCGWIVAACWGW